MSGRRWTEEEEIKLENMVGIYAIHTIAKRLNRTEGSITNKITRLGLGGGVSNTEGITLNKLSETCGVGEGTVRRWIEKGLKAKKSIKYRSARYTFIKIKDFWDFAYKNQDDINFAKIERNILGSEPSWVKDKRRTDIKYYKNKCKRWTKQDDDTLKTMYKYHTLKEIGKTLGRTEDAVNTRARILGIKKRVVIPFSKKEIKMLINMKNKGMSDFEIGKKLCRSSWTINVKYKSLQGK